MHKERYRMSPRVYSYRTPLVVRGHLLSFRMPRCNRSRNEQPVSLVLYQIWSPLLKESSRKPCTACRTWTRYTSCLRVVTQAHLNLRIRINPSTMYQGILTPHPRIILRRRCRSSARRECSHNWTSRRCFTFSIITPEHINSEYFPQKRRSRSQI